MNIPYEPMYSYDLAYRKRAARNGGVPFYIALERGEGEVKRMTLSLIQDAGFGENLRYAERYFKSMLWCYGGYCAYFAGDRAVAEALARIYAPGGARAFDCDFMRQIYNRPFTVKFVETPEELPPEGEKPKQAAAVRTGYRIGFDAGGSDRKVTACIDDKVVFEKEIVWHPKQHADIEYHIDGVKDSIELARHKLGGRVDGIGVSTAGIVVDGEIRVASLFRKVSAADMARAGRRIYLNLEEKYGCPVRVANDGDIAALAGAFQLGKGKVLGIAMGTSLAGGYVGENMDLKGYLNELAFVPVDNRPDAAADEWSGDSGVGTSYHSQDAVIRLASACGIEIEENLSPAEKLKVVQRLTEKEDTRAETVFALLGEYFGYTLLWYKRFYEMDTVVFLGRVASGRGGDILLAKAREIIAAEGGGLDVVLPDEMSRRLGQSYTATLL